MPRGLNDPTAEITIGSYFDTIELVNPKAFLLENVPGMAYKAHKESLDFILKRGEDLGYQLNWEILNAADYGVPQIRTRFILVGLKNTKFQFPSPTHFDPKTIKTLQNSLTPWVSAGSVLSDLDTEKNADDGGHYAGGKHNNLLKEIPPGDNYLFFTEKRGHKDPKFKWRSRYWSFLLKLSPDLPSWTIQARRSNNMGPFHWRNRILRIQEVKRLQTFPDNWDLEGNIERQWRQLGNAVPPVLAEKIGYSIYNQINLENNG
jgi:DNA (cytosine-5)-methyltransferase 1